jgi:hypothetical protein
MLSRIAEFEWAIILLLALGLGVWELVRIRRLVRQDRDKARGTRKGSMS